MSGFFATKSGNRFAQYMSNEPHEFGRKFLVIADTESKYILYVISYLGEDESRLMTTSSNAVLNPD